MEYSKDCKQCGKAYVSERSSSQFCSDSCRVAFSRSALKVSVTASVTEFGPNDFTREMVEEGIKNGESSTPNWYKIQPPFKSKNHFKSVAWKNV
jgi:hypothetical protein